ncbi:uncharacterized protein A1O5_01018 [Cladophialophora psammophila CBS 110553]|uniref:Carrier domain-containing protein n=1 Tax=Cladophialophora psammophila CBS 110553 TaxID=1182543 RepID=W9XGP5_9EURO|nr:uncharacterized protein A1O5_01018 [Cladophialophora psammophila CBS 110553]EXJ76510.1 hypothetical protein A1O5_01018 [Cladophialophora psammophila CBS 110553]
MTVNYFTCTLGQAVSRHQQQDKSYGTVAGFLDFKARTAPDVPVLGLYEVTQRPSQLWKPHMLTFKDIQRGVTLVAGALQNEFDIEQRQMVALLCPSSASLLFTWLGLVWLGHPVLLVAPQCSASAVAQLCKSCEAELMLYEGAYRDLAAEASQEASRLGNACLTTQPVPFAGENIFEVIKRTPDGSFAPPPVDVRESDVAYLHHTSGTSSGAPKPIPQTHRAAIGVLPILNGAGRATFTTTPLYHGGVADLFRAWTSNALIWLFPGKDLPITATNVGKCLEVAAASASSGTHPEVRYFSSVPYVLQMVADDEDGRRHLQRMDIVGVGGAALPAEVGDSLVRDNVNLVSRFGSAECGFLLSSHRDYANDKEWQYLRAASGRELLQFEPRDDGLSELIIQSGWPHMAKCNRRDGSFATADLFAPHPTIINAWRYHSRADSQLTLITGKKFDPAPLEDAIRASASSVVQDVLIFGNGRPYPGALLFPLDVVQMSDEDLLRHVAPVVDDLNRKSQSHARISKNMLIPVGHLDRRLEKSSKGTILRNKAEERFAEKIAAAYEDVHPDGTAPPSSSNVPDDEVPARIRDIVQRIVGECQRGLDNDPEALTEHTDLFAYGVDSVACIQIRHALSRLLPRGSALPLTVVEDTGTIAGLSDFVLHTRSGKAGSEMGGSQRGEHDQHRLMLDMVDEYGVFDKPRSHPSSTASGCTRTATYCSPLHRPLGHLGIHALLTGPTGSLGAHILHQLLSSPYISKIHLLVRGATYAASRESVLKALTSRGLPVPVCFESKTQIHSCRLSDTKLGLSEKAYEQLAEEVDVIIHLAWSVNFLLPLRAFAATHLAGTRNLINLALASSEGKAAPRFIFCSSVAAVSTSSSRSPPAIIPEIVLSDPAVAGSTGYARSKWVAEQICQRAAQQIPRLRDRISIARVGQLSGASDTGVWSHSEAYPLMLSSLKVTGCLPDLDGAKRDRDERGGEVLDWLPVDVAASAFVQDIVHQSDLPASLQAQESVKDVATDAERDDARAGDGLPVHHILNPCTRTTWSDLLAWLLRQQAFETVPAAEWLSRLSSLQESNDAEKHNHPALRLLGFWEKAYGALTPPLRAPEGGAVKSRGARPEEKEAKVEEEARRPAIPRYEMAKTYERMPLLRDLERVVNAEYVSRLWRWITHNV